MDLLFGLDMLKAHQACIDLEKGVLRIRGREVRFLSEHELPDKAKMFEAQPDDAPQSSGPSASSSQPSSGPSQPFPGSGSTLGAPPARNHPGPATPAPASRFPEQDIKTLMDLGATRDMAVNALEAVGGNVDYAASALFNF